MLPRIHRMNAYSTAFTAWDYAGLLCILYQDAGPKRCQHPQTSRVQSSLNPFYRRCNMLLSGLHHSPVGYPNHLNDILTIAYLHNFVESVHLTRCVSRAPWPHSVDVNTALESPVRNAEAKVFVERVFL